MRSRSSSRRVTRWAESTLLAACHFEADSPYGQPAKPEEFDPYFSMRDSDDSKARFLWQRMLASARPDPSDAGMAYFLVTGDEQADPTKLKRLLGAGVVPAPIAERKQVRIEAENFLHLEGYELEYRNDREVSHG